MKHLALIIALTGWLNFASGEMSAITVKASVVQFDDKSVTLKIDDKKVVVPRNLIRKSEIQKGKTVKVTFRGEQISYLFGNKNSDLRSPASAGK